MNIFELLLKFGVEFIALMAGMVFFLNKRLDEIKQSQDKTNDHLEKLNGRVTDAETRGTKCRADIEIKLNNRPTYDRTRQMINDKCD